MIIRGLAEVILICFAAQAATACFSGDENIRFVVENQSDSDICWVADYPPTGLQACDEADIEARSERIREFPCGEGSAAADASVEVALVVRGSNETIYDRTAKCRTWQNSDGRFVIEQDGGDFVVTDPLPN